MADNPDPSGPEPRTVLFPGDSPSKSAPPLPDGGVAAPPLSSSSAGQAFRSDYGSADASQGSGAPQYSTRPQSGARVEVGMVLNGAYQVTRLIGLGGMSEVFEGVNINDEDERVAIKVMLPSLAADPNVQAMFRKEVGILRRLSHPAVVQYRLMTQEPSLGVFYLVMEYIDGPSLSAMLGKVQPTSTEIRALLRRLAQGLRTAHDLGIVHRDMSPDNVLLPSSDLMAAKIADFGIAKELDPSKGTIVGDGFAGKLGYVAPEQFGEYNRAIGPWTDVYSLGLVAVSLALGRNVDMGVTLAEAFEKRRVGPDLTAAPPDLKPLLRSMLIADPMQRLRSMNEVLAGLDDAGLVSLETGPKAPQPPRAAPAAAPARERPRAIVIGGLISAGVAIAGAAALFSFSAKKPGHHPVVAPFAASRVPSASVPADGAIEASLRTVPCSWMKLVSAADSATGVSATVSGVAASPPAAQLAVEQAIVGSGRPAAHVDTSAVDQIGQPFCSALDAFSSFRTDTSVSKTRVTAPQTIWPMTVDRDGKLASDPVIVVRVGDPNLDFAVVGIEQSGAATVILPDRKAVPAMGGRLDSLDDDTFKFRGLQTTNPGWSGVLLLTGTGPFDKDLLETPLKQRDSAWLARIRQEQAAGNWRAQMAWYRSDPPKS